jgi:uncharacterized protein with FMN-binding domain
MEKSDPRSQKIIAAFVVIVLVGLLVSGAVALGQQDAEADVATENPSTTSTQTPSSTDTSSSAYKDGTYTASSFYRTPENREDITVSVTIQGGIVTASTVEQNATNPESEQYQAEFKSGYKQYVIGKSLDSISLSRVSGSSLTSGGFNDALEEIRNQAQG